MGHLALTAAGSVDETLDRLKAHGVKYTSRKLERTGVVRLFLCGPDGVGAELNFLRRELFAPAIPFASNLTKGILPPGARACAKVDNKRASEHAKSIKPVLSSN